jgi:hypothetical protein
MQELGKKAVLHALLCAADSPNAPFRFSGILSAPYLVTIGSGDKRRDKTRHCSSFPDDARFFAVHALCCTETQRCMHGSYRAEPRMQNTSAAATPEENTAIPIQTPPPGPPQPSVSVNKPLPKTHHQHVASPPRSTAMHCWRPHSRLPKS